ncbi:hypothetical protein H072_4261 [Dactylellina haptotyla CBS 200.50]|uniref:Zn(2)-C6 fungal-type domain-containing protein n=1 Tax=Dactylellina haptotyla (strain CBS 200.50) TaxID=1284197 RepID=S8AFX2_DACHA|nr:hypothetical protein H072_4261 [Dactylellina haptotyla CBS 200.50]
MPPKINTTCWRCRHDRQGCVRDPYDPETCNRCRGLRYTCGLNEPPPDQREGRRLRFFKCDYCRKAHQVCLPSDDPERCARCVERKLPCSALTNTKSRPRPRKSHDGGNDNSGSQGGSHSQDDTYPESDSPEYYEEEDPAYAEKYGHDPNYTGHAQYQYGVYSQHYEPYGDYPNYPRDVYQQDTYGQAQSYSQQPYGFSGY